MAAPSFPEDRLRWTEDDQALYIEGGQELGRRQALMMLVDSRVDNEEELSAARASIARLQQRYTILEAIFSQGYRYDYHNGTSTFRSSASASISSAPTLVNHEGTISGQSANIHSAAAAAISKSAQATKRTRKQHSTNGRKKRITETNDSSPFTEPNNSDSFTTVTNDSDSPFTDIAEPRSEPVRIMAPSSMIVTISKITHIPRPTDSKANRQYQGMLRTLWRIMRNARAGIKISLRPPKPLLEPNRTLFRYVRLAYHICGAESDSLIHASIDQRQLDDAQARDENNFLLEGENKAWGDRSRRIIDLFKAMASHIAEHDKVFYKHCLRETTKSEPVPGS